MKKKVLFLIESLGGGGAEKVLTTLVQHIDKSHFDVTVCVISAGGKYDEIVGSNVNLISIFEVPESYKGLKKLWYTIKYNLIYKLLPAWLVYTLFVPKGFDVEIAFVEGFTSKIIAASSNRKAKKIAWVHCDLKNQPWPIKQKIFRNKEEEQKAYLKFDHVVCVSKVVEKVMQEHYLLNNTKTIYNPVDEISIKKDAQDVFHTTIDKTQFNIVSVGRLEHIKGYDLLLPIIKHIKEQRKNIHLYLIGEGSERKALEQQAKDLGMTENVTFTGFLKNPYALMSKMNLFVCSSRAEGFSLVIAESMILGVPVISMNCSGPNELIGKNEYGILCNSHEQLEAEICKAVEGQTVPCQVPPMVDLHHTMEQVHKILSSLK